MCYVKAQDFLRERTHIHECVCVMYTFYSLFLKVEHDRLFEQKWNTYSKRDRRDEEQNEKEKKRKEMLKRVLNGDVRSCFFK